MTTATSQPIVRAGAWWQQGEDGSWYRWDEAGSRWDLQPSAPPPPPPPAPAPVEATAPSQTAPPTQTSAPTPMAEPAATHMPNPITAGPAATDSTPAPAPATMQAKFSNPIAYEFPTDTPVDPYPAAGADTRAPSPVASVIGSLTSWGSNRAAEVPLAQPVPEPPVRTVLPSKKRLSFNIDPRVMQLVGAVVAVLVVGLLIVPKLLGGGDGPPAAAPVAAVDKPTKAEARYAKKVNKMCSVTIRRIERLGVATPESPQEAIAYIDAVVPLSRGLGNRLAKVDPPRSVAKQHRSYVSMWNRSTSLALEVRADIIAADAAGAQAVLDRANALEARADGLARELGIEECAKEPAAG